MEEQWQRESYNLLTSWSCKLEGGNLALRLIVKVALQWLEWPALIRENDQTKKMKQEAHPSFSGLMKKSS